MNQSPRRPRLVLGLGGEAAGDDAIGLHLADALRHHPALPADVEVVTEGADLLRAGPALAGRSHVVLVDALEAGPNEAPDEAAPLVADHPAAALGQGQGHVHHLDAVQALELLVFAEPGLAGTRFTWFLVPVSRLAPGEPLSPAFARRVPELCRRLLDLLGGASAPGRSS